MTSKPVQATSAPVSDEPFLPFAVPCFDADEERELLSVLASRWLTTGPVTRRFEAAFAEFIGCTESLAVNSCTAALHLSLVGLGIGPGDAVITSPFTFAATANVIVHQGARPVFVDIRNDTYNLDPVRLEEFLRARCDWDAGARKLTLKSGGERVRAIIVVHYAGHPCDMEEINAITAEFGLPVIEDAAHAVGSRYHGRNVGTLGDVACFSFYATKNMTTGEGGMLTTNNRDLAERVRVFSLHGISKDAWKRYSKDGSWRYDVEEAGFKYNLTDLASSLGVHQLRKLPGFIRRRTHLAEQYGQGLRGLPLQLPVELPGCESSWHLYPVQAVGRTGRDELIERLREAGIGTSVHFIPLHLTSFYRRRFGYGPGDFPVAERVFDRILSLPLFPGMRDEDVSRVCSRIRDLTTAEGTLP